MKTRVTNFTFGRSLLFTTVCVTSLTLVLLLSSAPLVQAQSIRHPIMHYTGLEKSRQAARKARGRKTFNAARSLAQTAGSANLLSLVPYDVAERDQAYCGNCWVWASTGVLEVAYAVASGAGVRLSTQYFNSNYNQGGTVATQYGSSSAVFACNGGSADVFTQFYLGSESGQRLVPWSNTNAAFADQNGGQSGGYSGNRTNMAASSIAVTPSISLAGLSTAMVSTAGVDQSQAIANIKAELDAQRALYFGFCLPDDAAWTNFSNFWENGDSASLFDYDPYNGLPWNDSQGGCHAVLLVGYNDTDPSPSNHYWLLLNSWGATSHRPDGTFRVKMNMNYDNADGTYHSANLEWDQFLPTFSSYLGPAPAPTPETPPEVPTITPTEPTAVPVPDFLDLEIPSWTAARNSMTIAIQITNAVGWTWEKVTLAMKRRIIKTYHTDWHTMPSSGVAWLRLKTRNLKHGSYRLCITTYDEYDNSAQRCTKVRIK
jgi:hypothetical protein